MENEMKQTRVLEAADVITAFYWDVGKKQDIGSRNEQQDRCDIVRGTYQGKPALLAVLADGMGGMKDGARFSQITVDYHIGHFQQALDTGRSPQDILLMLAVGANKEAHKIFDEEKPGGSTLVTGLFVADRFYMLSIGDSRIYLFRKHCVLNRFVPLQLNREHILGTMLDERAWMGKISFEDAQDNMYRDSLTSGIGPEKIRRVDWPQNSIGLLTGDRIVFVSDGIYRTVSESEMAEDMGLKPADATDAIVRRVLEKKARHQDNLSILIVERISS